MILYSLANADLVGSISNIIEDDATLTTSLTAQAVPWSDVAGSYELNFGHAMPALRSHRLKRGIEKYFDNVLNSTEKDANGVEQIGSGLLNSTEEGGDRLIQQGEGVLNTTKGNIDQNIDSFSFSIDAGQQGQRTTIHTSEE